MFETFEVGMEASRLLWKSPIVRGRLRINMTLDGWRRGRAMDYMAIVSVKTA